MPGTTPGGRQVFDANLSDFKNLIEDFNHLSLDQVTAYALWFMGDVNKPLKTCLPGNMTMRYLGVNAGGNAGLVACFKQECRTVSCLVWHTIKNHFSTVSYKALLVCKKDFVYKCSESSDVFLDGYTLLHMIYIVVKPNVIVNVKDIQTKMEQFTILKCNNNFHTLSTTIEKRQQEINAKKGNDFCKDDKLLTELFRAAKATTNEAFAMDIHLAKSAWITGKITDKNVIINDLNGLYRNMIADGSWKKVSSADSKIIALTTQVCDLKKQLGNSDRPKCRGKQGKDPKTPAKPGKEVGDCFSS